MIRKTAISVEFRSGEIRRLWNMEPTKSEESQQGYTSTDVIIQRALVTPYERLGVYGRRF